MSRYSGFSTIREPKIFCLTRTVRCGRSEQARDLFAPEKWHPQAASALGTIAAWRGTVLNHQNPIIETELPIDGSRFEGIVSPVVRRPVFAIRLRPRKVYSLDEYEASGILSLRDDALNRVRRGDDFAESVRGLRHSEIIRAAVRAKKNILVVGSTGSGKTTFVNACLDALRTLAPHDRVITIEDTIELQCGVKNYLDLRAVGSVSMLDCLRACMRLKPTRIVVGEVRGAEAHKARSGSDSAEGVESTACGAAKL